MKLLLGKAVPISSPPPCSRAIRSQAFSKPKVYFEVLGMVGVELKKWEAWVQVLVVQCDQEVSKGN